MQRGPSTCDEILAVVNVNKNNSEKRTERDMFPLSSSTNKTSLKGSLPEHNSSLL